MGGSKPGFPTEGGDVEGLAVSAQVDAAAVLDAYVAVLEASDKEIRPETDLPYDRDVIKSALIEGLGVAEEEERELLETAFLALAWFQPLGEAEKRAVDAFDAGGDAEDAPEALETEEALAQSGADYAAVLTRIEHAARDLRAELREQGYGT